MSTRKELPQDEEISEVRDEVTEPPDYRVLIHNDDYTTKEFVVQMLMAVFSKSAEEASEIMWRTHQNGVGLCGVYPRDVAETKVRVATEAARENGYPLMLTIEEA
ncbi:MAG: ATP-dependent Clp protease adaptor ClpS [Desulfobacterales bacterium]